MEETEQMMPSLSRVSVAVTAAATAIATVTIASGRRLIFLREASVMALAYAAYFLARAATEGEVDRALANAERVVGAERSLGVFVEPALQAAIIDKRWLVELVNGVYVWGFWPVIVATGLWLYLSRPHRYLLFRNAFLISGAIGLVLFTLYPTAPPRLAGLGLVDTISQYSDFYRALQAQPVVNQYAAIPSLHFGWILLVGIALICDAPRLLVRAFGVVLPLLMLGAIILSANHYGTDAFIGAAVALAGLALAVKITRPATPGAAAGRRPAS